MRGGLSQEWFLIRGQDCCNTVHCLNVVDVTFPPVVNHPVESLSDSEDELYARPVLGGGGQWAGGGGGGESMGGAAVAEKTTSHPEEFIIPAGTKKPLAMYSEAAKKMMVKFVI